MPHARDIGHGAMAAFAGGEFSVQTLEQALLPAMETFVTAAHAHAVSKGRSEVSDADFNAILAKYKKVRAGKGKK